MNTDRTLLILELRDEYGLRHFRVVETDLPLYECIKSDLTHMSDKLIQRIIKNPEFKIFDENTIKEAFIDTTHIIKL